MLNLNPMSMCRCVQVFSITTRTLPLYYRCVQKLNFHKSASIIGASITFFSSKGNGWTATTGTYPLYMCLHVRFPSLPLPSPPLSFASLPCSSPLTIECLLDGAAGQVPAMCIMQPWMTVATTIVSEQQRNNSGGGSINASNSTDMHRRGSAAADSGGGKALSPAALEAINPLKGMNLIAISSERSSFVVAVEPQVRLHTSWNTHNRPHLTRSVSLYLSISV